MFSIRAKGNRKSRIEVTIRRFLEIIKDVFRLPVQISHINARNRKKQVKKRREYNEKNAKKAKRAIAKKHEITSKKIITKRK